MRVCMHRANGLNPDLPNAEEISGNFILDFITTRGHRELCNLVSE